MLIVMGEGNELLDLDMDMYGDCGLGSLVCGYSCTINTIKAIIIWHLSTDLQSWTRKIIHQINNVLLAKITNITKTFLGIKISDLSYKFMSIFIIPHNQIWWVSFQKSKKMKKRAS